MNRYVIKLKKMGNTKYISHLDTMRTLHRAIRRAGLPLSYSKGFNPHPSISFASPLSVGIESFAEYIDIEFDSILDNNEILEKINLNMPIGLEVLKVIPINKKMPTCMAATYASRYEIRLKCSQSNKIEEAVSNIINAKEIIKIKKTKSGEKSINIREMIFDLNIKNIEENHFTLECVILTSNSGSLSPEVIADVFKESVAFGVPIIKRTEMYTKVKNDLVPLDEFFSRM